MSILDIKRVVPERRNVLADMTLQRKGKAKELDQDAGLNETILQKDNIPERQGEVQQEKKIVLRVSTTTEDIVVMIESVIMSIPRIANISRKL